ncbi:ankyrin repeat domain-containing protein [Vibrio splendidus]
MSSITKQIEECIENDDHDRLNLILDDQCLVRGYSFIQLSEMDNEDNLLLKYARRRDSVISSVLLKYASLGDLLCHSARGVPAFFYFSSMNKEHLLEQCIEKGVPLSAQNAYGQNCLGYYVKYAPYLKQSMIQKMVDLAFQQEPMANSVEELLNHVDNSKRSPMLNLVSRATENANPKNVGMYTSLIRRLVDLGADINLGDKDGYSPLLWTTIEQQPILFQSVLKCGGKLDELNKDGDSPLYIAIKLGLSNIVDQCVLTMTERGLTLSPPAERSPVLYASRNGDFDLVMSLLSIESDVNVQDTRHDMHTPLIYAIKHGNAEAVDALLDHGANPNLSNHHQVTPLMYCVYHYEKDPLTYRRIIQQLLCHNVSFESRNRQGKHVVDIIKDRDLVSEMGTVMFSSNISLIADEFFSGDEQLAKDSLTDLGPDAYREFHNKDISQSHLNAYLAENLAKRRHEDERKLEADIDEGKRLLKRALVTHVPVVGFGVGTVSEKLLEQANGDYMIAGSLAIGGIASYFLGFNAKEKLQMKYALMDMITSIEEKICAPYRSACNRSYAVGRRWMDEVSDTIRHHWCKVKRGLSQLFRMLSPSTKERSDTLTDEQILSVVSAVKCLTERDLTDDSLVIEKVRQAQSRGISEVVEQPVKVYRSQSYDRKVG